MARQTVIWSIGIIACCTLEVFGLEATNQENSKDNISNYNATVCGPRCVQLLLQQFGVHVELIELVEEMQSGLIADGATLASIAKAIESRGLHTACVKMSLANVHEISIAWSHPIIVHLSPSDDSGLGHYVVWLPGNKENDAGFIWDGLQGYSRENISELLPKMSGFFVLSSPNSILSTDGVMTINRSSQVSFFLSSYTCVALTGLLLCYYLKNSRRSARGKRPAETFSRA